MNTVLVAGATGQTGRRVVERLLGRTDQVRVRVLARDAARARRVLGDAVQVHVGDVRDPDSLVGLGVGVDVAISTIGTRTYFGANGGARVDAEGTRHLVAVLAAGDVRHLVLLSAFGLDRRSVFLSAFSAVLGQYFRYKAEAEAAVRASGLDWTLVRPVELRNRPAWGVARLNQAAPLGLLRTVSRDLVAEVVVACVDNPAAVGRTFEVCEAAQAPSVAAQLGDLRPDGERPRPDRTPLFPPRGGRGLAYRLSR